MSEAATEPEVTGLGRTFRALRNPNYRLYWSGQAVSMTGTWMQTTALAWLVLKLTDSGLALGSVIAVQFLPVLMFALFGGVIADRFPKRNLLLVTQTVMMCQALALAILVSTGSEALWQLYILAAVQGMANALDVPVRQSFTVEMVGAKDLPNAIALNASQFQFSRLLGPALGGAAIPLLGIAGCFFVNSASFLIVCLALLRMDPKLFYAPARRASDRVLTELKEGLRFAVSMPDIAMALIMMAVIGTFGFNWQVLMPLIAKFVLDTGPVGFGLLTSSLALGSLLATLSVAYISRASRTMLFAGAGVFGALMVGLSLSHWLPLSMLLLAGLGASSSMYSATNNSRLQLLTPSHLRGRVMGLNTLLFQGSTPIGSLAIGLMSDTTGVEAMVAELGAICLLGVMAALIYRQRHASALIPDEELMARAYRNIAAEQEAAMAAMQAGSSSSTGLPIGRGGPLPTSRN